MTADAAMVRRRRSAWLTAVALSAAIFGYYWLEWRTFQGFVDAVDHHPQFMQDFVGHYYPMAQQILRMPPTPVGGYYYTSFFALVISPVGRLSLPPAMTAWAVCQVICLVAFWAVSARGLLKLTAVQSAWFAALCMTSYPLLNNLKWGQVSVLLTMLSVAAVAARDRRHSIGAGILLGLAAAIKFYPGLLAVYFIVKRDVRACVSFAIAGAIFYCAIPAAILGWHNWFEFENTILNTVSQTNLALRDPNSQYLTHVGLRWFASVAHHPAPAMAGHALTVAGFIVAAGSVVLAWFIQRGVQSPARDWLSMSAVLLATPFLVKTSWPHYFVYLPVCQAAVLSACTAGFQSIRGAGRIAAALCIASILISSVFVLNLFPGYGPYNADGMVFVANAVLLVAVVLGSKLTGTLRATS